MSKVLLSVVCFLMLAGCAISMGLQVSIRTDPPSQPYPAAIWIHFACHVENAIGTVFHNWTAFCSRFSPPLIVGRIDDNENNHGEFTLRVRSTPPSCLDTLVCNANDSTGQTGNATWHAGAITGAGLWGRFKPLFNNSALVADSGGQIDIINCHSSSFSRDVGQWISPAGRDITENHEDKFFIVFNNGPYYPSYNTFQLQDPQTTPFSPADQGVYSCIVPDNNGVMQTLHIGIYPHGYQGALQISSVSHTSRNPVIINCASTGYPPTLVIWYKSGERLTASATHQITSVLTNRLTSDYDNLLTINQPINEAAGVYVCSVTNAEYEPTDTNFTVSIEEYHIALYAIGSSPQITCTLSNHSNIQWVNENGVPVSSPNGLLNLVALNDTIHGNEYYCRGYDTSSVINNDQEFRLKVLVLIPDFAIQASATQSDSNSPPLLGQHYAINCRAVKTTGGLMNSPQPQWAQSNGTPITDGNGISLTASVNGPLVLSFSPLRLSHAGSYQCRAILSSPALKLPLIVTDIFNITITIPAPEVSINTSSGALGNIFPGSTVILHCDATVNMHVDTAVIVQFTWKDAKSGRVLRNSNEIAISDVSQLGPLEYRSMLIVSDLSADSAYLCEARVQSENSSPVSHILPSSVATTLPFSINITEAVCTQSFEVMFGVDDCNKWRFDNTERKIGDVIMSIVEQINQQCPECQINQRAITNTEFSCNEDNLKIVTFHARISGGANCNKSFEAITKWAQSGEAAITVNSIRLKVEPDCNMLMLPGMGCNIDENGNLVSIGVGVGSAVALLLVVIGIVVTVFLCVVFYNKKRKHTTYTNSRVYANPIPHSRVEFMMPVSSSPTRSPVHSPMDWLQPTSTQGVNMSSNRNLKPEIEPHASVDSNGYIAMSSISTKNDTSNITHSDRTVPAVDFDRRAQHTYVNFNLQRYKDDNN